MGRLPGKRASVPVVTLANCIIGLNVHQRIDQSFACDGNFAEE